MVITRVQKTGRIDGRSPTGDARIIDQFMDDVVLAIGETSSEVGEIVNNITIIVNSNVILQSIGTNIVIPSGAVVLQRCPTIEDGVEVAINDGGEFLVL